MAQRMNEAGSAIPDQNCARGIPVRALAVVLSAGDRLSANGFSALDDLCRAYWPPLYSFLRRQGQSPHDVEDLVQGFLAPVLVREDLAGVGPEKARFRTFLLTSLRNFVIKQALRNKALKRGGGQSLGDGLREFQF